MQWFKGVPTSPGLYFYSDRPQDWYLARPVPVRRVDEPGQKPVFSCLAKPEASSWENVERMKNGIWFGPIQFPDPHPPELRIGGMRRGVDQDHALGGDDGSHCHAREAGFHVDVFSDLLHG